jgi:hypothetical protein
MAYATGMLLGAFLIPYLVYGWRYLDDDEPFMWYQIVWPAVWLWRDIYFHSKASFRRVKGTLKIVSLLALCGAWIGWGIADGLLRLL